MIILDVEQGTWEWRAARLAIPTTSQFEKIVTPTKLKPGKAADTYLTELLAEWATGKEAEEFTSAWAERGTRLEPEARRFLRVELGPGTEVEEVGFVYRDDERMVGCSPDALVRRDGEIVAGVEIKCPATKTHIRNMLKPDSLVDEYRMQIQGGLWVTGLPRWYACSYHPGMPPVVVEVEPDDEVFGALDRYIPAFVENLQEKRSMLLAMGVEPKLSDAVPEWALPSVDMMPLTDEELERFEVLRREVEPEENRRLLELHLNGSFRELREWMAAQREVVPA